MATAGEDDKFVLGKGGERRMKGRTIAIPVVTGTCAFYLGKKVGGAGCRGSGSLQPGGPLRRGLASAAASLLPPPLLLAADALCALPPSPAGQRVPVAQVDDLHAQPHGGGPAARAEEGDVRAARKLHRAQARH